MSGGKKRPQNVQMGAKSAPKTTKWGQKVPPHKLELKSVGAKSAVKMQKWGQKAPSKQQSDGKSATTFKSGGTLATISVIVVVH